MNTLIKEYVKNFDNDDLTEFLVYLGDLIEKRNDIDEMVTNIIMTQHSPICIFHIKTLLDYLKDNP